MSDFTYETGSGRGNLETYEWDNTWLEQAPDRERPRVLYIGDSISCGTRRKCTEAAKDQILFDGFGSSKGPDNPFLPEGIRLFARQEGHRELIFFNCGLHGWHLEDETDYARAMGNLLDFLKAEFPGTPLVLVNTTAVANPARLERVRKRNAVAEAEAGKRKIPVLDLFSLSLEIRELQTGDGVHFTAEGYEKMGAFLAREAAAMIKRKEKEWI